MNETCKTCAHFKPDNRGGQCRRYPPTVDIDDYTQFPRPQEDDWCGEYIDPAKWHRVKDEQ